MERLQYIQSGAAGVGREVGASIRAASARPDHGVLRALKYAVGLYLCYVAVLVDLHKWMTHASAVMGAMFSNSTILLGLLFGACLVASYDAKPEKGRPTKTDQFALGYGLLFLVFVPFCANCRGDPAWTAPYTVLIVLTFLLLVVYADSQKMLWDSEYVRTMPGSNVIPSWARAIYYHS